MSEFPTINLVLGIVGTVTGIIALFISYWTSRKENPRLNVKILSCEHSFTVSKSGIKNVSFWVKFRTKNLGDRGTTIIDVDLILDKYSEGHHVKKQFWKVDEKYVEGKIWLNAHEALDTEADFVAIEFPHEDKELLDCTFTIYHTHGAKTVQCISNTRREGVRETSIFIG
jgi:hypothetical protein